MKFLKKSCFDYANSTVIILQVVVRYKLYIILIRYLQKNVII